MAEIPGEEQAGASADEARQDGWEAQGEAQRNLTSTVVETYLAFKVVDTVAGDMVSDAYGGVKAAGKAVLGKIRGHPDGGVTGDGKTAGSEGQAPGSEGAAAP
jgi:hypothetical protein